MRTRAEMRSSCPEAVQCNEGHIAILRCRAHVWNNVHALDEASHPSLADGQRLGNSGQEQVESLVRPGEADRSSEGDLIVMFLQNTRGTSTSIPEETLTMDANRLTNAIMNVAGFRTMILRSLNTKDMSSLRKAIGPALVLTDAERLRYCSLYSAIGVSADWIMYMNKRGYAVIALGMGILNVLRWVTGSGSSSRILTDNQPTRSAPIIAIVCVAKSGSRIHNGHDDLDMICYNEVFGISGDDECEYWYPTVDTGDVFKVRTEPLCNMAMSRDACGMGCGIIVDTELQDMNAPFLDPTVDGMFEMKTRDCDSTDVMSPSRNRTIYVWTDMTMDKPEIGRMMRRGRPMHTWPVMMLCEPNVSLVRVGDGAFSTVVDWRTSEWTRVY
ncbi:hypothetical protein EYC84_001942 [Monilinia fructicola]|uniref:Uncharacterized protein n=1 Tax=Monilinia fructicola TaxID=38448 RepID=A0A5M9JR71_MONFR|nr:hypothetical protein EYC84_001942 [Monilinia fructicola]